MAIMHKLPLTCPFSLCETLIDAAFEKLVGPDV